MPITATFGGLSQRSYGFQGKTTASAALVGDFDSISTTTLGSNQSTVTFSSIPQTYTHLQLRCNILSSVAGGSSATIRFNSDSATNYSWHTIYGSGAAAGAGSGVTQNLIYLYFTGNTTSPSGNILDILDYTNTNKFKTSRILEGFDVNGVGGYTAITSGNWRSTAAITSIVLTSTSGTFNTNSSFALYGMKA